MANGLEQEQYKSKYTGSEIDGLLDFVNDNQNNLATLQDIPTVPSKTSDLTNDNEFITNTVSNLLNYYLKTEVYSKTEAYAKTEVYAKTETYTKAEIGALISASASGGFIKVNELPTEDINTKEIYLVPYTGSKTGNLYEEYIYVDNAWEMIGTTKLDLSNYVTTTDLSTALGDYVTSTALNTALADYLTSASFNAQIANYYNKTEITGLLSGKIDNDKIGAANGVASLGNDGKVPSSQLPEQQSGHIIVDQSGTVSTQRSKLKFINAIINDDAEDDATVVIAGTGTKLDDVTGTTASSTAGVKKISVSWTDPNDMVEGGITLAEWAGTLVVRKEGSAPESKEDGTVVVNSKVRNAYAVTGYDDDTANYGVTYYYRFFPYTNENIYTDGSCINASVSRATISIPSPTGNLTYDGTAQTMPFNNDSSLVSVSGNSATNAGNYTATAHLIDSVNNEWSDHTIADKTVTWTIEKAKVLPPTVTGSFTYDGTEKTANVSTYDNTIISVTEITGTNAGTYTATLSLINSNYQWADETTADKTENWTIAKAAGSCELTPDSITLDADHLTGTATISSATGTVIGVQSSAPEDVSATLNGNDIVVTAIKKKGQTVTVLVQVAESANYEEAEIELSVICDFMAIVTWADGTDAEIAAMLEAHYAGKINIYDFWEVGDERTVALSAMSSTTGVGDFHYAQNVTLVLMNEGGKTLTTAVNGKSTCAFIVGQKHSLNKKGCMNRSSTNSGGWDSCARRTWCNSVYKNALPSTLVGIFKQHQNITANGSSSSTTTSSDYFALPSEKEVFGSTTYADATAESSNTQFKYYETSSNRIKNVNGSASNWWGRSPHSSDATRFCRVSGSGDASYASASYDFGLAPFGCI